MEAIAKTVQKTDIPTNISYHIEEAFGEAPFDIYSYKGIYHSTENGFVQDMRHKMVALYETGEYTQKDIALLLNCSERVVRKWISRYRNQGSEGLKDLSRTPHHRVIKVTPIIKEMVAHVMNEYRHYGCRRVARELEKSYDVKINHESINQVMNEIKPKKPKIIPKEIEIPEPDIEWQMDMTQMRIIGGSKQYIFSVMDSCTRQVHYVMNYSRKSSKSAIHCLKRALKKADTKPKYLRVDNGRMFISMAFRDFVFKRKIILMFNDKGSPWENGKVERLFGTLKGEWLKYKRYKTPESLNNSLKEFRRWFNGEREIQKLEYRTPNEIASEYRKVF